MKLKVVNTQEKHIVYKIEYVGLDLNIPEIEDR